MKTEAEIRFKQWQDALRSVKRMRDALVELGVTDPEILGGDVIEFDAVKATSQSGWIGQPMSYAEFAALHECSPDAIAVAESIDKAREAFPC